MTTEKKFASHADLEVKQVTFEQISEHAWAYTAEGDPNTGIIIGDDAVLVADTQATPAMAAHIKTWSPAMTPKVAARPPRMPPLPVEVINARLPGPGIARNNTIAATKAP